MHRRRKPHPGRWVIAATAALLAHVPLVAALLATAAPRVHTGVPATVAGAADEPGEVDERPLDVQVLVEDLEASDRPSPMDAPKKPQKPDPETGQVVDIARPEIEAAPEDDAAYLARFDSRVARQTAGPQGDRAGASVEAPGDETERSGQERPAAGQPLVVPGRPGRQAPSSLAAPGGDPTIGRSGSDGESDDVQPDGEAARAGASGAPGTLNPRAMARGAGEGGLPGRLGLPRPELLPSDEMLKRALVRGSGSRDYLPDVDSGERTALNAKSYVYATFFNRLQRAVGQEWQPSVVHLRHDPDGTIVGVKDRITVVRVELAGDGAVHRLSLGQSSGIDYLDDEAMSSLRRAAPYVNPPAGLADEDGVIRFSFMFTYELSGRASYKLFRYE